MNALKKKSEFAISPEDLAKELKYHKPCNLCGNTKDECKNEYNSCERGVLKFLVQGWEGVK